MEYVEGVPIDAYCDEERLSVTERLELIRKVMDAVQYAHQKLIVHRDLKPSNILVAAGGEPKLLDFGIARVWNPDASADPATATELRLLTPHYASPEQVRGESPTTASDVFSLAVVLHELLTCHEPGGLPDQAGRELRHRLCGDLDAILRKAMSREPEHRYASIEQFSQDIQRHLRGFPVLARKATVFYRGSRYLRRNAAVLALAATLVVSLIAGILATARQARIARRERDDAVEARKRAETATQDALLQSERTKRVSRFLQSVLTYADPARGGPGLSAVEALDLAAKRVSEDFGDDPRVEYCVHTAIGQTYQGLGRYDDAERHMRAALAIEEKLYGATAFDPDIAQTCSSLAVVLHSKRRFAEARYQSRWALRIHRRLHGDAHPTTVMNLNNLAAIARAQGELDLAERYTRKVLGMRRALYGQEHTEIAEKVLIEAQAEAGRSGSEKQRLAVARALVELYDAWKKPEKAARLRARYPRLGKRSK